MIQTIVNPARKALAESVAMQMLRFGQISASDLCYVVLTDRERMLEEIAARDRRILLLENCLKQATQMIECLSDGREMGR
jgi:uncharacterized metal-binding protein